MAATQTPLNVHQQHAGDANARRRRLGGVLRALTEPRNIAVTLCVIIVAYLTLTPLVYLLVRTFSGQGGAFGGFSRAFSAAHDPGKMIANSLEFGIISAVLALAIGTCLAYLQVRTDVRFKILLLIASLMPLVIPGLLYALGWIMLIGPKIGLFNTITHQLFGAEPFNAYSLWGMIWVQGLHTSPIAFLFMVSAFGAMDPSLEESAFVSGASQFTSFRRITLPLLRPAVVSSLLLVFVLSIESFEVPAVLELQRGIFVFVSELYDIMKTFPIDYGAAGALACVLLGFALVAVLAGTWFARGSRKFQTITGRGFRPEPRPLGRRRGLVTGCVIVYFVVTVALPVLIIVYAALTPYLRTLDLTGLKALTLDNFTTVLHGQTTAGAFKNSLILGIASATVVIALSSIVSWLINRTAVRGRRLLETATMAPLVIPGLVLGLALLFIYLRSSLPIYGTLLILLLAYTTKLLPYGMRYVGTSMRSMSVELEESARVCGATWWQSIWRVTLPLVRPAIIGGWVFVLITSLRELSAPLLVYSPGKQVISIEMWVYISQGQMGNMAALGTLLIGCLVVLTTIGYLINRKFASHM